MNAAHLMAEANLASTPARIMGLSSSRIMGSPTVHWFRYSRRAERACQIACYATYVMGGGTVHFAACGRIREAAWARYHGAPLKPNRLPR